MPQLEMELQVDVEGRPSYRITHREFVNPINLARCGKGAQLPVLIEENNPEKLILDWR
jgi:hypothetical protein